MERSKTIKRISRKNEIIKLIGASQRGDAPFFYYSGGGNILEKTLYSLIELQEIDMKLDKVREERGDLPERVELLNNTISEKENFIKQQKLDIKKLKLENKNSELDDSKDLFLQYGCMLMFPFHLNSWYLSIL